MTAAVWAGLSIRFWALQGLDYWLWWDLAGSSSYHADQLFGMVDLDGYEPWYAYYVLRMFAANSAVGDVIVESSVSSDDFRSFAWVNDGDLCVLVVYMGEGSVDFGLSGVSGDFGYEWLDADNIPPRTGVFGVGDVFSLDGYSVLLLTQPIAHHQLR